MSDNGLDRTLRQLMLEASLSSTGTRYFAIRTNHSDEPIGMAVFTADPKMIAILDHILDPKFDVERGIL